ncbi:MAG: hypothetical protein LBM93_09710 [Oscillospiraceae bacterium]|jgi:hypothetical protein|nr:hypothetical protein [Oscillospiraceae bacterium]
MKTFILAMKLFYKNLGINLLVIVQIAFMAIAMVLTINVTSIRNNSVDIFEKGKYRIILAMNPLFGNEEEKWRKEITDIASKSEYFVGEPMIGTIFLLGSEEDYIVGGNEKEYAELHVQNDFAIDTFYVGVSQGRALHANEQLIEGKIPCVIGGMYAKTHKIGDTISGYVLANFDEGGDVVKTEKAKVDLIVVGKMLKPEQHLDVYGQMSWGMDLPASSLIYNYYDYPLIAMVPSSLYPYIYSQWSMKFLSFDKDTPESEINRLKEELGGQFAKTDTEMIGLEQADLEQDENILKPFILLLLLTGISGTFVLCLLSTVKNIKMFAAFLITGSSFKRNLMILFISALMYMAIAAIVFFIALHLLQNMSGDLIVGYYFILLPQTGFLLLLTTVIGIFTAFTAGIIALKSQNLMEIMREN